MQEKVVIAELLTVKEMPLSSVIEKVGPFLSQQNKKESSRCDVGGNS